MYGMSNSHAMYLPYMAASVSEYPWDAGGFEMRKDMIYLTAISYQSCKNTFFFSDF